MRLVANAVEIEPQWVDYFFSSMLCLRQRVRPLPARDRSSQASDEEWKFSKKLNPLSCSAAKTLINSNPHGMKDQSQIWGIWWGGRASTKTRIRAVRLSSAIASRTQLEHRGGRSTRSYGRQTSAWKGARRGDEKGQFFRWYSQRLRLWKKGNPPNTGETHSTGHRESRRTGNKK